MAMKGKTKHQRNKQKRVTTRDIAAACGISQASVSMILSGRPGTRFKPETVTLVKETAKKLGYVYTPRRQAPDHLKRTIMIMCPSLATDYYVALVRSVSEYAESLDYYTFVSYTMRDADRETAYLSMAVRGKMAGVIYTYAPRATAALNKLADTFPVVIVSDRNPELPLPLVELDSFLSGSLIGRHLIGLGHRRIAYLSGPLAPEEIPRRRRLEGLQQAAENAGFPDTVVSFSKSESEWLAVRSKNRQYKTGYDLTMACCQKEPLVTAFVGANDVVAFGCLDALAKLGYHAPADYSVCGFDNSQEAAYAGISLTTIDHCIDEKGKTAVDMLFAHQKDDSRRQLARIEYKPQLIVRDSTGPARKNS